MPVDVSSDELNEIIRSVFDDDALVATSDLTPDDVLGWDSFAHMRLVMAVEQAFGVNFTAAEAYSIKSIGELVDLINAKKLGP
jgi:acyl carrier protein